MVEHHVANVIVAGSNPVTRSIFFAFSAAFSVRHTLSCSKFRGGGWIFIRLGYSGFATLSCFRRTVFPVERERRKNKISRGNDVLGGFPLEKIFYREACVRRRVR